MDPQDRNRQFRRSMLRARFQSLFWAVLLDKKQKSKFTLTDLAEAIGIHKSYVSRSFTSPPNWQIDKISDFSDALGVDLEICAVDRHTGEIFTPQGKKTSFSLTTGDQSVPQTKTATMPTLTFEKEVQA